MKKKEKNGKSLTWLNIICGILFLLALFLGVRFVRTQMFIRDYEKGIFDETRMEDLLVGNIPERYLPYYNLGNIAYKKGDYDEAIIRFEEALTRRPGLYREENDCAVRVNLALAMVKQIDLSDLSTDKKVKTVIKQLQAARNVLTENGCANPKVGVYDGHSEEAEQLKKEIDELIAQLQQNQEPDDGNQGEDQEQEPQDNQNNNSESQREKDLRKKMEDQKRESAQERADAERDQNYSSGGGGDEEGDGDSDFNGKEW